MPLNWSIKDIPQDVTHPIVTDPEEADPEEADPEEEDPYRVYRGGSWNLDPRFALAASRLGFTPRYRSGNIGFRLVEEADE
jgi:formylglycine-generating enzyme required for sulfatase activity